MHIKYGNDTCRRSRRTGVFAALLINHYKETGSRQKNKKSGRPRTAKTKENEETVEEIICSQDEPHTHQTPRQIEQSKSPEKASIVNLSNCQIEETKFVILLLYGKPPGEV